MSPPHIAILGAGPVGLDAALACAERGYPFRIYEAGSEVGAGIRRWGHVRLFSPWSMDVSARMRRALGPDLDLPEDACPTGSELIDRVLVPLAATEPIASSLRLSSRVLEVGREGLLKHEEIGTEERRSRRFRIVVESEGEERVEFADVVIDATGQQAVPNRLGDGGVACPGERSLEECIDRRIPDLASDDSWSGCSILLLGAGHSAQTAAVSLAALVRSSPGTRLWWALRRPRTNWHLDPDDPLRERYRLTAAAAKLASPDGSGVPGVEVVPGAVVARMDDRHGRFGVHLTRSDGSEFQLEVDRVLALTGGVGDASIYRQLQVHECYATSGPMKLAAALLGAGGGGDCLSVETPGPETLENPEPGFFLLGSKSYGRNNTFLLRSGWEQVDAVFEELLPGKAHRTGSRSPES